MSSEVDGIGIIAAPVILPAAVAFGAGWACLAGRQVVDRSKQIC